MSADYMPESRLVNMPRSNISMESWTGLEADDSLMGAPHFPPVTAKEYYFGNERQQWNKLFEDIDNFIEGLY